MKIRHRIRLVVAAFSLACAAGCAALLLTAGSSARSSAAAGDPMTAVRAQLEVLRRPATPADAIGSDAASLGPDVDAANARRVSSQTGAAMWIAPAASADALASTTPSLCLVTKPLLADGAVRSGCSPASFVLRGQLIEVVGRAPRVEVLGVVPDGVASVTVHLADGAQVDAPVTANGFDVEVDHATASISFASPNGEVSAPAPSIDGPAAQG